MQSLQLPVCSHSDVNASPGTVNMTKMYFAGLICLANVCVENSCARVLFASSSKNADQARSAEMRKKA